MVPSSHTLPCRLESSRPCKPCRPCSHQVQCKAGSKKWHLDTGGGPCLEGPPSAKKTNGSCKLQTSEPLCADGVFQSRRCYDLRSWDPLLQFREANMWRSGGSRFKKPEGQTAGLTVQASTYRGSSLVITGFLSHGHVFCVSGLSTFQILGIKVV